MRDAEATRRRIVAAATAEFATHGLAGARVDRIAAAAQTSKPQIYSYFGSKERLFDAIFDAFVDRNLEQIPMRPDDLPGYAVAIHDAYLDEPELVRLATWARLERQPDGDLFARQGGIRANVVAALADAQRRGVLVDDLDALDLFSLLISVAGTWAQASLSVTATAQDPESDHERRRAALARTVRRAFCR